MPERLPTELVLAVFREAAENFVISDRPSVLAIALTSRLAFNTVESILLRRITVIDNNTEAIQEILGDARRAALILDVTLASNWDPPRAIFCNLTKLQCLRGYHVDIASAISGLPSSGLTSLYKIQVWGAEPPPVVPPSVSHLCYYNAYPGFPPLGYMVDWVTKTPTITHLGCEFVSRGDVPIAEDFTPEMLTHGLHALFTKSGQNLCEVSIRLCGEVFTTPSNWTRFVEALRREGWAERVRLWRDSRNIRDASIDLNASISDSFSGVDVWSEARPLLAFICE